MAHNHSHGHIHGTKNIKTAFFLNLVFTVIEIIGGIMTNSVAILSDAVHDLGDSLSLGLAWYFQNYSKKERTHSYSYGYRRFSLLGSSINERVVSLHLLEDVLGWIAVLIGSIIMHFYDLPLIDPILSLGIAAYILINVYKNLKETIQIVMQGVPVTANVQEVENQLLSFPEINAVHDIHIWSMDGEYHIMTAHIELKELYTLPSLDPLKKRIRAQLYDLKIEHVTLEFETSGKACRDVS